MRPQDALKVHQPPLILVIEDDPGLNMMIRHRLVQSDFSVITALSGAEGISLALSRSPSLMLLDYALPDMICTDLVQQLNLLGECPPFIIVTGQGDERVAVNTMKLGAQDYLIKDESLLEMLPHVVVRACEDLERARRLVAAREEIKRLNAELELRVQTRTAELNAAHQRARLMMEVAEGANQASDPESAVQISLRAACQHARCVVGHCWWLSDRELISSGQWYIGDERDYAVLQADTAAQRWTPGVGVPGQIQLNRQPLWLEDLQSEPRLIQRASLQAVGLSSGIFVPVLVDGTVHAVLELFSREPLPLDPDILEFLTRIAVQFGSVVRRRRAEEALHRARDIADQASRAKSLFLASMSHEIRTPMNAILGFAQLLHRDAELTTTSREHIDRILRSGSHLLHLIDDVLEMSKIEAGRITITPEPMALFALVRDLEAMFRERADARGLGLEVLIAPGLSDFVLGDVRKIRQILINLLSNAMKFTDEGGIILRVFGGAGELVRFEVEDTGTGIPEEERELVFLPFEQSVSTRQRGGTGLGLAISHRLASLMGGRLLLESPAHRGSIFTLEIPLPATADPIRDEPPPVTLQAIDSSQEALVVDDEEDNRLVLAELLSGLGFTVHTASSGGEALARVSERMPAVLLLDLRMPGMDGRTVCQRIRAMPGGKTLPIVMVSASVLPRTLDSALKAGADRFLRKPILLTTLLSTLSELLGLALIPPESPAQPVPRISLSSADLSGLSAAQRAGILQATRLGDIAVLEALIPELPVAPAIQSALQELADDFRYDQLQDLFAPIPG